MNLILLLILIAEACLGLCCWRSPEALRCLAAHLLTRADVIQAAQREHSRRLQFWQLELGVERAASNDNGEAIAMVESVVHR
jgi:hypothetical protein